MLTSPTKVQTDPNEPKKQSIKKTTSENSLQTKILSPQKLGTNTKLTDQSTSKSGGKNSTKKATGAKHKAKEEQKNQQQPQPTLKAFFQDQHKQEVDMQTV